VNDTMVTSRAKMKIDVTKRFRSFEYLFHLSDPFLIDFFYFMKKLIR